MSLPEVVEDDAWCLILQARCVDWSAITLTSFRHEHVTLEVMSGGAWMCTPPAGPEAAVLLDLFLPLVARGALLAIAQIGQSLDGRIATESGHSHYVNCDEALRHLHRLRAVVDAVVVGVGTADADQPQLTVRHVAGPHPVRVVLDPRARARCCGPLFEQADAPTLHVVAPGHGTVAPPVPAHVERIELAADAGGFAPQAVLALLASRGLGRVLVEGGGVTVSRFVQAGALDRLHIMVAPLLIGSGRPGLTLPPIGTLDEALRPRCRSYACGSDTLFDLELGPIRAR
jgi:diaminohydroxyphosphoribosylaminopyrimidine deaminase/5-amino-6-(5-phosphoribosylamino)uracil reductase